MIATLITVLTSLVLFGAAGSVFLHQILLNPDRPNYPTADRRVRIAMALWGAGIFYRAGEILGWAMDGSGEASLSMLFTSAMAFALHVLLLEQVLRSWLPARLHARIRDLLNKASCGHAEDIRRARKRANEALWPGVTPAPISARPVGPALAQLTLEGVQVIGPNEGLSAPLEGVLK